ncbi:YcnI family protein [Nocardia yamanashiensis]|uniref:YcnI family protein n=1 Tax=Nocardia yamanashiensis TaxID=209247 RepID=UPI000832B760|nr:YcnI family protein [Nocardia yamanashiensis]
MSAADATPGGFTVLTVRVPNESATAGTVKVEVSLPQDNPLAVVRTEATPGWTAVARRATLATPVDNGHGGKVSEYVAGVTFTARDGNAIGPGEFTEFRLQIGPLPHVNELVFPAVQTYSDGSVVSWIERSADGTTPDKPAPILKLSAAHGDGHGKSAAAPETAAVHNDSSASIWLAGLALAISAGALASSVAPRLRGSKPE